MTKAPLLLCILFLSACVRDVIDKVDKVQNLKSVTWHPTIAAPLIYANLGMDDILQVTGDLKLIRTEQDNSLTLVYSSSLFSLRAADVFQLPDRSYTTTINLSPSEIAALNSVGTVTVDLNKYFDLSFDGNELDSVIYRSGDLEFVVTSDLPQRVTAELEIPDSRKDGQALQSNLVVQYPGSPNPPSVGMASMDLEQATIGFTSGPQNHSEANLNFHIVIERTGAGTVTTGNQIRLDVHFRNQKYRAVHGLINNQDISNGADTLKVALFNQAHPGSFTLADPRAKLKFKNSFGIQVSTNVSRAEGINIDDQSIVLSGYPNPFVLPMSNVVGEVAYDSVVLNKDNSNLRDYVNNQPYENIFEYDLETGSSAPGARHWITDSSVVECTAEIEIPIYGTAQGYSIQELSAVDLELENVEEIKELMFRLYTENGYPVDIELQVYFEDTINNVILDSLLTDDLLVLPAGNVDGNGKVTSVNSKLFDLSYDWDRVQNITKANAIRLRAYFNSLSTGGSQPDVRFYADYTILIQLGLQAQIQFDE